jgi:hypothetical protein
MIKIEDHYLESDLSFEMKRFGLREKCAGFYVKGTPGLHMHRPQDFNDLEYVRTWRRSPFDDVCSAPLLTQALDWLRREHDIHVTPANKYEFPNIGYYAIVQYYSESPKFDPPKHAVTDQAYPSIVRGVYETGSYNDAIVAGIRMALDVLAHRVDTKQTQE